MGAAQIEKKLRPKKLQKKLNKHKQTILTAFMTIL